MTRLALALALIALTPGLTSGQDGVVLRDDGSAEVDRMLASVRWSR
ncbi:MAG: hypothetical protein KF878_08490 [Planctomycetes bacterium]|nr:hypothetical protein [Planctomycetota bacterium]